jgi:hypothetical protein
MDGGGNLKWDETGSVEGPASTVVSAGAAGFLEKKPNTMGARWNDWRTPDTERGCSLLEALSYVSHVSSSCDYSVQNLRRRVALLVSRYTA